MTISENFESFQYFNFWTNFLKNENLFKKLEHRFLVRVLRWKTQHLHTKLPCQKPMLRQVAWGVQNGPIPKGFASNYCQIILFQLRTSYKEWIWCINNPKCIHTFRKHWSFIYHYSQISWKLPRKFSYLFWFFRLFLANFVINQCSNFVPIFEYMWPWIHPMYYLSSCLTKIEPMPLSAWC